MTHNQQTLHTELKNYLIEKKISYQHLHHPEALNCSESAKVRGTNLAIGGKSLLLKSKKQFYIFSLSAEKQLNSNAVRKILGDNKLRFATQSELLHLTGASKGFLPPLGKPFYPFPLYLDISLFEQEQIVFNAGEATSSFLMKFEEYLKLTEYKKADFSK